MILNVGYKNNFIKAEIVDTDPLKRSIYYYDPMLMWFFIEVYEDSIGFWDNYRLKDISALSEEELFQESTLWKSESDIYKVQALQKFIKQFDIKSISDDDDVRIVITEKAEVKVLYDL